MTTVRVVVPAPDESDVVARFTVPGEPVSKSRARFTKRGSKTFAYTPEKTLAAEDAVAWHFKGAGGRFDPDKEATFGLTATFRNGTRQRRDVDNMLKLLLDALNGIAWVDDTQVMEVSGRKEYVNERSEARTEVLVYRVGRMDRMTGTCENCGATFRTYKSWGARRHCSEACHLELRKKARMRVCATCGKAWDIGKPTSQARYCSPKCRRAVTGATAPCTVCGCSITLFRSWVRERNYCSDSCRDEGAIKLRQERRGTRFPGSCVDCGVGTSRKEYQRCKPCSLKHRYPRGIVDAGLLSDDRDGIVTGPDMRRDLPNGPLRVTVELAGEVA